MDITERRRGDRRKLARLIAKEPDSMQRDWLRSVLLALEGREAGYDRCSARMRRFRLAWPEKAAFFKQRETQHRGIFLEASLNSEFLLRHRNEHVDADRDP